MKRVIFLVLIIFACFFGTNIRAQSLPSGTVGIVYTYDAAGNRTKQEYVINNGATQANVLVDSQLVAVKNILRVNVLYPNPTTGYFTVRLVKQLNDAMVTITGISGRLILQRKENGFLLHYNLSQEPAGVYLLNIIEGKQSISIKILKR